jgi:hypothetical protein
MGNVGLRGRTYQTPFRIDRELGRKNIENRFGATDRRCSWLVVKKGRWEKLNAG